MARDFSKFREAFNTLVAHEGGYVNNPFDTGGVTKAGITQSTYNAFKQKTGYSPQGGERVSKATAADMFRFYEWMAVEPYGLDFISTPGLLVSLSNAAWGGASRRGMLRRALHLLNRFVPQPVLVTGEGSSKIDKRFARSLDANPGTTEVAMAIARLERYMSNMAVWERSLSQSGKSPSGKGSDPAIYLKGWLKRALDKKLLQDVKPTSAEAMLLVKVVKFIRDYPYNGYTSSSTNYRYDSNGVRSNHVWTRGKYYSRMFTDKVNALSSAPAWLVTAVKK